MKPILAVALLALATAPAATADNDKDKENKLSPAALKVLQSATEFELYSIDPGHTDEKAGFHKVKIVGKTAVKDADTRNKLVSELTKAMEGDIKPARCFNPRHGIRAAHDGKTVDLVICFECSQFYVYEGKAEPSAHLLIGKGAEPALDKVLKDAGVPKPKN